MSKFEPDYEHLLYASDEESDFAAAYLSAGEAGVPRIAEAVETRLVGRSHKGGQFDSVRALTDAGRDMVPVEVKAGTRVRFNATASSMLAYPNPPDPDVPGTVVAVKTASGAVTSHEGQIFVRFDGQADMQPVYASHLRLWQGQARQGSHRIRVASLGDLTEFMRVAEDRLIHKATRDLWAVKKDGEEFVIERLFADSGQPLKV